MGGWALAAFVIFPTIYRAGMYTNAEYLEARFSPAVRVICALIQVQYRTLVLAIIATTLYLTLSIVCGWGVAAWWAVAAIAALAAVYTALGGLRSVAVTDALQFAVMTIAGLIIWVLVWNQVGGWNGQTGAGTLDHVRSYGRWSASRCKTSMKILAGSLRPMWCTAETSPFTLPNPPVLACWPASARRCPRTGTCS